MADKPTVVLVHGFWGGATHWGKVIVELRKRGYDKLNAVEVPLTSLADDAGRTREMLDSVEGPIVLVGHSYGGAVITEAGGHDKVQALVYVAAFAPDAGESPGGLSQARPPAAFSTIAEDDNGYLWVKQEDFRESFCQDLPEDEALVMAVTQKAPKASTFGDEITDPAWKSKPSWYQVSTQDRMIDPDNERQMAQRMQPREIVELDASHASLASQPAAICDLIDKAAQEVADA